MRSSHNAHYSLPTLFKKHLPGHGLILTAVIDPREDMRMKIDQNSASPNNKCAILWFFRICLYFALKNQIIYGKALKIAEESFLSGLVSDLRSLKGHDIFSGSHETCMDF